MQTTFNTKGILNEELGRLTERLQDQAARKEDFLVPSMDLLSLTTAYGSSDADEPSSVLRVEGSGGIGTKHFAINEHALGQIATEVDIPVRALRTIRQNPAAQTHMDRVVTELFQSRSQKQKMLRTFAGDSIALGSRSSGELRAFVSSGFKTFDNIDLLAAVLPAMQDSAADWKVVRGDITETKMYLQLKSNNLEGAGSAIDDIMALGIGLSNSEVGAGSISLYQMLWTLICLNGMQYGFKHAERHLQSARDTDTWSMLRDETKALDNRATAAKMGDIVAQLSKAESFEALMDKMRAAGQDTLGDGATTTAIGSIDRVIETVKLQKSDGEGVLAGLMNTLQQDGFRGRPVNRATIANAITAHAHHVDTDRRPEFETAAGRVLDLSATQWERLAA
jgi:hypothetical protein